MTEPLVRVVAIDPTSHGFAYAVLEGASSLIDWGGKEPRPGNPLFLSALATLLEGYRPDILALEDVRAPGSRRLKRARRLLAASAKLARRSGISVRRFSRRRVRSVFSQDGAKTKHEIAVAIAQRFPELADRLPYLRRGARLAREDRRMDVFDALSFGLAVFLSQHRRNQPESRDGEQGANNGPATGNIAIV